MDKEQSETQKFLIDRLGVIRTNAKLSTRELSLRLGKSASYISNFSNGKFVMSMDTLFDAIEICGSTPEEFFSDNIKDYQKNKEIMDEIKKLPFNKRDVVLQFIKQIFN